MAFYNHSLLAVAVAKKKYSELGIPFDRPVDYFCESVKSDTHMQRVSIHLYVVIIIFDYLFDMMCYHIHHTVHILFYAHITYIHIYVILTHI